jgi:ABC-2 type transport system ATP-binding protein
MSTSIRVDNLSVILGGNLKAIDDISLELPDGKIIGFIGPSGAGKTTLIRSIVGNLKIASGTVQVLGEPAGAKSLRDHVSYMTQELSVYPDLTVKENIEYFSAMAGQPRKKSEAILHGVLGLVDLTDKRGSLVGQLSGGQKQRVSLAVALIGSPKLMVLDEPTVGLDPVLRENLWNLFAKLAQQGTTLIVSSHSMDEASRCDDLVLIRDGKLVAHDSPEALLKQTGSKTVEDSFLKLVGAKS